MSEDVFLNPGCEVTLEFTENLKVLKLRALFRPDTEKVASMQALLADKLCENCGHFCINNEYLVVFTDQLPQVCINYPQLIYFSLKYPLYWIKFQCRSLLYD